MLTFADFTSMPVSAAAAYVHLSSFPDELQAIPFNDPAFVAINKAVE